MTDINAIAEKMVQSVKAFVARAESAINKRIDDLEKVFAAAPDQAAIERIVSDAVAKVPLLKGDKGDAGESIRGEQGIPGERGESIKGDKGDPGERGPVGESIRGEAGPQGKDGASIHPDTVALMVREAVDKAVAAIPSAKDGQPGRDAAELAMLPGIDETRSYPAGTWASHAGGLIRASRATDPVTDGLVKAGWVVMVDGVSAVVVTQGEDPRELTVAAMLTSGTKAVSDFRLPAMIYRGVWREGEHQKGDVATWGGSAWHCQEKTTDKPGTSPAWKMMVKEGARGKDGAAIAQAAHEPVRLK